MTETLQQYWETVQETQEQFEAAGSQDVQGLRMLSAVNDNIRQGVGRATSAVGDINAAEIIVDDELPANIAGQYRFANPNLFFINPDILIANDNGVVEQTLIHEQGHQLNDAKADTRLPTELEEGIVETRASLHTGKVLAYPEEVAMVGRFASAVGQTRRAVVTLFEAGENEEILELYNGWTERQAA